MFHHSIPHESDLIELSAEYSIPLVLLSIAFVCFASYTALALNQRVKNNSFFHKNFWFILASVAMGFGIWAMHYVGMLAFSLPVEVNYDYLLTILSIIPTLLASFFAFYLANRSKQSLWSMILTSIIMGLGVSSIHFIGMASMKTEAHHTYNPVLLTLSIFISFFAFFIFNFLQAYMHKYYIRILTSIIMGVTVFCMHQVGMQAMTFYVQKNYEISSTTIPVMNLEIIVMGISVGMIVLLGVLLLSSLGDRYIEYRAKNFDPLTQLPNHRMFEANMKNTEYFQLAIWHIHDLEYLNREYGYQFGDIALQRLAVLFDSLKPESTDFYRIEGNRFAFVSRKTEFERPLKVAMEEVAKILDHPIEIQQEKVIIPAVCAISILTGNKKPQSMYIDCLAVLNYHSITYVREVLQFDPTLHKYTFEHELAEDIVRALKHEELYLVYQPKVDGHTKEIVGLEALLRWNHPIHGLLSPAVFIPILEKNDRMIIVTDWIIDKVCSQISEWREDGLAFHQVSINIPGHYVTSPHLLEGLKSAISQYRLMPYQLELEITETSFVKNMEEAMRAVSIFRQEGFSVALDDFGTGVSSLSYLKQMTISTLKIDKSFVDDIPESEKDSSIIRAIIALGESLDLAIVIEGVEKKEQVEFLVTACKKPIIQGYYFAKPMIPKELIQWKEQFQSEIAELV